MAVFPPLSDSPLAFFQFFSHFPGSNGLEVEKLVPRKTEPIKGEYVYNRMEKSYVEYDLAFAGSGRGKYNL